MTDIKSSALDLIGRTPLIALDRLSEELAFPGRLYGKIESANLTGSMKDRVALAMIRQAEKDGRLKLGGTIIEPTSGNTGIGLAAVGSLLGYRVIIVMPDSMSKERRKLMEVYGAELVLTPGVEGMAGAIAKAKKLADECEGAMVAGQFENPANPQVHYEKTGPEIWCQTGGRIDALVGGIGTGGSISGAGRYLKEQDAQIQVVGIEPVDSAVLSGGEAGPHGLQGIGAGFIPCNLDNELLNDIESVGTEEAWQMIRLLARREAIFAGVSSGAALVGALHWANKQDKEELDVVVLLPDTGMRYLSSPDL